MKKVLLTMVEVSYLLVGLLSLIACQNLKAEKDVEVVPYNEEYATAMVERSSTTDTVVLGYKGVNYNRAYISHIADTSEVYLSIRLTTLDEFPWVDDVLLERLGQKVQSVIAPELIDSTEVRLCEEMSDVLDYYGERFLSRDNLQETYDTYEGMTCWAYLMTIDVHPVYVSDDVITYSVYDYCDTGGAHGMESFYLLSFDRRTRQIMTFDDLVKEGKRYDVMRSVILRAAKMLDYPATNHYLQNIDNAAIVMSFPMGTVGLNSQGMVFCYAPYDIAAGCYGCPVIVIPNEELEDWMNIDMTRQ